MSRTRASDFAQYIIHDWNPWSSRRYERLASPIGEKEAQLEITPLDVESERHGGRLSRLVFALSLVVATLAGVLLGMTVLNNRNGPFLSTGHDFPSLHASPQVSEFLTPQPWNYSTPSPCGSTPHEARLAGCRWSPMTFAWYPEACYDAELDQEFLASHEWEWYTTEDLLPQERLPRDAVLAGNIHRAYMSMDYHKLHCMYTVRKLYRAIFGFALSDTYILTIGHLHHCEQFVLRNDTPAVKGWYRISPTPRTLS